MKILQSIRINANQPYAFAGVLIICAAVFPTIAPSFWIFQMSGVMAYAIAALGLNVMVGYGGQISLGHNAFFAAGAYLTTFAINLGHWPFPLAIAFATLGSFMIGVLAGLPAQRVRGLYLVLITLILALIVTPLIKVFKEYTGGMAGVMVERGEPPSWFPFVGDAWTYYAILLITLVAFYLTTNWLGGQRGRALATLRDRPLAAEALGINGGFYRVMTVAVGAALGGAGGGAQAYLIGFIAPDSFGLMLAISFFAAVVVGGLTSPFGALVAGCFLQFVPAIASDIGQSFSGAVYGIILIAFMFVLPGGISGGVRRMLAIRKTRGARRD